MDEDTLNMEVRRFLKEFGVTTQREIEDAIREAIEDGSLSGDESLLATATARLEELDVEVSVDRTIALE